MAVIRTTKPKPCPTTRDMESAIARRFGIRANLMVPNVSWGMRLHECDILSLSTAGYATEIEIKISIADLKADIEKPHGHVSNKIKFLYFAVPEQILEKAIPIIPERAGIIVVRSNSGYFYAREERKARENPMATKWTDADRYDLARLGCLRIWALKDKIEKLKKALI